MRPRRTQATRHRVITPGKGKKEGNGNWKTRARAQDINSTKLKKARRRGRGINHKTDEDREGDGGSSTHCRTKGKERDLGEVLVKPLKGALREREDLPGSLSERKRIFYWASQRLPRTKIKRTLGPPER